MEEFNPYQPPMHAETTPLPVGHASRRVGRRTYAAWIFVFCVNLAVPLLFSSSMTRENGRIGMSIAALLLLVLGFTICAAGRKLAAALIVGGAIVGMTQLFPVLHIIAGMLGMGIGQALGLADIGDDGSPPRLINEYGGFVVTFVTGGILMIAGACLGMLLRLITPAGWWQRSEVAS